jgi:hypothetical protein
MPLSMTSISPRVARTSAASSASLTAGTRAASASRARMPSTDSDIARSCAAAGHSASRDITSAA